MRWRQLRRWFWAWFGKCLAKKSRRHARPCSIKWRSAEMGWRRCLVESLECRVPLSATPTSISVEVSTEQAVYGAPVTLTAAITASPTAPSEGTVTFLDDGNVIGTAPVSAGAATLAGVKLNAGNHEIGASFSDPLGGFAASSTTDLANSLITTVAGIYSGGVNGDNVPATSAYLSSPESVAVDADGNLFIADSMNNRIRKVEHATGIITTVAGDGTSGFRGDGGDAATAELHFPKGVALDAAGDIFIADTGNNRIREVNHATGVITTVAGDGIASAQLNDPWGVAVDSAGNIYIADSGNNRVVEVLHATGNVGYVAGNGTEGFSGDNALAASAEFNFPYGVAVDAAGNIFIADTFNSRIREVDHDTGIVTTVAGNGTLGYSGDDGLAASAGLDRPYGVAVDSVGNIFIADSVNNRVREVNHATGVITTVAGNGTVGSLGDGGFATSAAITFPTGAAFDSQGDLFIADNDNNEIRELRSGDASLSVITATLTITANNRAKAYGADVPTLSAAYSGFVNGDSVASLMAQPVLSTTAAQASAVGNYAITVSGAADPNYTITYVSGVLSVLPRPVATVDVYVIGSGAVSVAANQGLLANDTPSGGSTVTAGTVVGETGGAFHFNADGSFTYTPPAQFAGYDRAHYTVADSLGDTSAATVTVLSHEGGVVWKFYESVLGRSPDNAGLSFWINHLAQGGSTGDMAVAFAESDELLNQVIGGYYQQYLGRAADAAGLAAWKSVWRATGGPEIVQAYITASPEFFASAGGTNAAWLTALYQRVLGRTPDAAGFGYWEQQLAVGASKVDVVLDFLKSPEAFSGDVTSWFDQDFGVQPTVDQLHYFVNEMLSGTSDAAVERQLASSPAYSTNVPSAPPGTAVGLPEFAG